MINHISLGKKGLVTDETPQRVNEFKFNLVVLSLGLSIN